MGNTIRSMAQGGQNPEPPESFKGQSGISLPQCRGKTIQNFLLKGLFQFPGRGRWAGAERFPADALDRVSQKAKSDLDTALANGRG